MGSSDSAGDVAKVGAAQASRGAGRAYGHGRANTATQALVALFEESMRDQARQLERAQQVLMSNQHGAMVSADQSIKHTDSSSVTGAAAVGVGATAGGHAANRSDNLSVEGGQAASGRSSANRQSSFEDRIAAPAHPFCHSVAASFAADVATDAGSAQPAAATSSGISAIDASAGVQGVQQVADVSGLLASTDLAAVGATADAGAPDMTVAGNEAVGAPQFIAGTSAAADADLTATTVDAMAETASVAPSAFEPIAATSESFDAGDLHVDGTQMLDHARDLARESLSADFVVTDTNVTDMPVAVAPAGSTTTTSEIDESGLSQVNATARGHHAQAASGTHHASLSRSTAVGEIQDTETLAIETGMGAPNTLTARSDTIAMHANTEIVPVAPGTMAEQVRAIGQVVERHLLNTSSAGTGFEVSFGDANGPVCSVKFSPSASGYDVRVTADPSHRQALSDHADALRQRLGTRGISVGSIDVVARGESAVTAVDLNEDPDSDSRQRQQQG